VSETLTLAEIVGVHGIKGWVKLRPFLEDPKLLQNLGDLELKPGPRTAQGASRTTQVDALKLQGKGIIAHLKGLDDRTEAEALRGYQLCVAEARFPQAAGGEYYWRDLVGLRVWCQEEGQESTGDTLLGVVDHLLDTGANDVLVVRPCEGSIDDRERLIPWLEDSVIERVDTETGDIRVVWFVDV